MRHFNFLCLIFLSTFLQACSIGVPFIVTDPRTDESYFIGPFDAGVPGMRELATACATEAEVWVKETVYVDGYLDSISGKCGDGCWLNLLESDFKYQEIRKKDVKEEELPFQRVTKLPFGHKDCADAPTKRFKRMVDYRDKDPEYCLKVEDVKEPISRYERVEDYRSIVLPYSNEPELDRSEIYVLDRGADSKISKALTFILYPNDSQLSYGRTIQCASLDINRKNIPASKRAINPR